jgi:hypothetical protein
MLPEAVLSSPILWLKDIVLSAKQRKKLSRPWRK